MASPLVPTTALPAQRLMADVLGPSQRRPGAPGADGAEPRAGTGNDVIAAAAPEKTAIAVSEPEAVSPAAEVSLSSQAVAARAAAELPIVFAEIWRDGLKVATIDARGGVKSFNGMVASSQGTGGNSGILLAARRAAEVAASIGGEIRVGGEPIDKQTLSTRAKLAATYGAGL